MLADRNVNRPSYVLALLLGVVALVDAFNALSGMQVIDPCAGLSNTAGLHCGTNAGWFVDLLTSGICAVLAETDVINMVSRGITTPNIIKGIHLSIASRIIKLLSSLKAESPIVLTGGMALNKGMIQAIEEQLKEGNKKFIVKAHPDSIYAGAIGAALWGGFRHYKLLEKQSVAV